MKKKPDLAGERYGKLYREPNPKPAKKTKRTKRTASEQRHCDAIHEMCCAVTGLRPVIWHHVNTGMGRKKNDFMTIPLIPALHTKDEREAAFRAGYPTYGFAIHERRARFEENNGTESELLYEVYRVLDVTGKLEPGARAIWESLK